MHHVGVSRRMAVGELACSQSKYADDIGSVTLLDVFVGQNLGMESNVAAAGRHQ